MQHFYHIILVSVHALVNTFLKNGVSAPPNAEFVSSSASKKATMLLALFFCICFHQGMMGCVNHRPIIHEVVNARIFVIIHV